MLSASSSSICDILFPKLLAWMITTQATSNAGAVEIFRKWKGDSYIPPTLLNSDPATSCKKGPVY